MVVVAVLVLNALHPGYCFREGYVQKKYKNLFRRKQKVAAAVDDDDDDDDEKGSPASGAATPVRDVGKDRTGVEGEQSDTTAPS